MAVFPSWSVACAVKVRVPGVVGVPVMVPPGLSVSPAGSDPPVIAQVQGEMPPVACRVVV